MSERERLMMAVVEAARNLQHWQPDRMTQPPEAFAAWGRLNNAIDALRFAPALPAQPQGETMTLAVWTEPGCGDVFWAVAGSDNDECPEAAFYHRRTVTLPLNTEPTP